VTSFAGSDVKVLRAAPVATPAGAAVPGTVMAIDDGIVVACGGETLLRLLEVQPASRRAMTAISFASGARMAPGARLG
jgi:methionyl-tRNA formyltransferase